MTWMILALGTKRSMYPTSQRLRNILSMIRSGGARSAGAISRIALTYLWPSRPSSARIPTPGLLNTWLTSVVSGANAVSSPAWQEG